MAAVVSTPTYQKRVSTNGRTNAGRGEVFVIRHDDKTASHYDIKEINGQRYLFLEWKTGDVTILGRKPQYYVMRWSGSANVPTRPARAAD